MSLQVRFCETDLMGIVHHANYLLYFEAGRVDWLHRRSISYDVWTKQGIHLPVVESQLRYRKAARFDDVLHVDTTCALVRATPSCERASLKSPRERRCRYGVSWRTIHWPPGSWWMTPRGNRASSGGRRRGWGAFTPCPSARASWGGRACWTWPGAVIRAKHRCRLRRAAVVFPPR